MVKRIDCGGQMLIYVLKTSRMSNIWLEELTISVNNSSSHTFYLMRINRIQTMEVKNIFYILFKKIWIFFKTEQNGDLNFTNDNILKIKRYA